MNPLLLGVGLLGPLVVAGAVLTFNLVEELSVDEVTATPSKWTLALACAGALAAADVIVAATGYDAPLATLVRIALGGVATGLLFDRQIGSFTGLTLVLVHWRIAVAIGCAIHIGILWIALCAI